MPTVKLSRHAIKTIDQKVTDLFDRLRVRMTGLAPAGKRLYIQVSRDQTLPGIYGQAVTEEGGTPDYEHLNRMVSIVTDLLDKHASNAKAAVKYSIQATLEEAQSGRIKANFRSAMEQTLNDLWRRVSADVRRVVETETQRAQTLGIREGIGQVNARAGVDDPVVAFLVVHDNSLCDECRRLHLLPDGFTPRVWLTSEVAAGYHKKGEDQPSWALLHPHCRCTPITILPGYGFDQRGKVTFKAPGWNELQHQRG